MRLQNIARMIVMGWVHGQRVTISGEQQAAITDGFARALQSIQDEERKGFRDMLEGAIATCQQHDMQEGVSVLQAILEADAESEARQDG